MPLPRTDRQPQTEGVDRMFVDRWSPRALDPDASISDQDLDLIFEAARWSPSSYNEQPWAFLVAKRGDGHFETFLDLLVDQNRNWAQDASAIAFIAARKKFSQGPSEGNDNRHNVFDCGAAWMSMTLQANELDWYTHGMAGVKYDEAREGLGIPDTHDLVCALAIGRRGDAEDVAELSDAMRKKEQPNGRKPLGEVYARGTFAAIG